MKIKNYIFTLTALLGLYCPATMQEVNAQELKTLTLEDLNFGGTNYHNMVAKNRWTTWWGDKLVRQDAEECFLVDLKTGKETKLFNITQLRKIKGVEGVHSLYQTSFPDASKTVVKIGDQLINWKKGTVEKDNTPKA